VILLFPFHSRIHYSKLYSQDIISLPALDIVARVDQYLNYPNGLLQGKLTIIHNDGRTRIYNFDLYKGTSDCLYIFQSKRRGLEEKILFNEEGRIIYVFDALNKKLFTKKDDEKYESAANSGYSYVDISFNPLQANYDPKIIGEEIFEGKSYLRLELKPAKKEAYNKIYILVDPKKQFRPVRFDYLDKNNLLLKSMTFQFSKMKIKKLKNKFKKEVFNTRRDIIHLSSGTISILEIFSNDLTVKPDKSIYDNGNLNR
jgi:hypothetical protein